MFEFIRQKTGPPDHASALLVIDSQDKICRPLSQRRDQYFKPRFHSKRNVPGEPILLGIKGQCLQLLTVHDEQRLPPHNVLQALLE